MPGFRIENEVLYWEHRSVACQEVSGFQERYGRWSGKVWLEVAGPNWRIPVDESYGATRSWFRAEFPDLPFNSDWMDGRFPRAWMGLPDGWSMLLGLVFITGMALAVGLALGIEAALLLVLAAVWPFGHLRSQLVVQKRGVKAGAAWTWLVAWHEIEAVRVSRGRMTTTIGIRAKHGGDQSTIPSALLPAVRARVWRLGGLEVEDVKNQLDDRYLRWLQPARGIPWGILLVSAIGVWVHESPWTLLTLGIMVAAATALLGAAVQARATGWGGGGVLALVALYGLGLFALSMGMGGWVALP